MIKAYHGKSVKWSNLLTDIGLCRKFGFDGLGLADYKLQGFLNAGFSLEELKTKLDEYSIKPVCINDILSVESIESNEVKRIMEETEIYSSIARAVGCKTIQLVPLCSLEGRSRKEILKLTARNIRGIADIGNQYGVRFQIEPVAWSPIHSLSEAMELIKGVERDNVGLNIDFWHFWAGGETTPDQIAGLDKSIIYCVHFCDGKKLQVNGECDETELRDYLPGEGDIPLTDWVAAVKATGYDGVWACEMISKRHWEMDIISISEALSSSMDRFI